MASDMAPPTEPVLIVVGLGLAAFLLAFSRIVTAEAKRALDMHFVRVNAMRLRNDHARIILALRPASARAMPIGEEPIEVSPVDEFEQETTDEPLREAA